MSFVTGTAAGEVFEFVSSSTNNTFTNVVINAAGGQDTIKATQAQNVDATITGLDSSSVLDFGNYNTNTYYYLKQDDGIDITNLSGNFKVKLLGSTDTSICSKETVSKFMERQQESPWDGWVTNGTNLADTISVNHSNCFVYSAHAGDDLILTAKNNNTLRGAGGNDVFICGGTNNTIDGGDGNDRFEIYSYTNDGTTNVLTGGNGNNEYIISTGLVSVEAANAETTTYDPFTADAVNVTITDAKAGDSYYLRDYGIDGLNMSTTSDGVVISSTGGQINITMKNCDWNSVKDNLISLDNAQGLVGTYTLEQAVALSSMAPTGIYVAGKYLNVTSDFVGKNDGNDAAFAGNNDVVYLYDVSLSDIVSAGVDANTIALGLSSGNVISVVNGDALSPTFVLADDSAYRYDYLSGSWQKI